MIFCNQDTWKTITAMSFKLGQLTEEIMFFALLPFANLDIENLIPQKLLQLGASNLDS